MMKSSFRKRELVVPASIRLPLFFGLGVVIVILLARFLFPGSVLLAAAPLWKLGTLISARMGAVAAPFADTAALLRERDALLVENDSLRNENRTLTARLADIRAVRGGAEPEGEGIVAGVLARPPVSPYDVLIVAAGSRDGVVLGAPVYAGGGVPIGFVAQVYEKASRLRLYSSPGEETEGWVGDARIPVKLSGRGAGGFSATLPASLQVAEGDIVYAPGPGALPLALVTSILRSPSSPEATLRVRPLANPFSLSFVLIGEPIPGL